MYLISDTAIYILGCRSEVSQCIMCTILMIAAHVLQLFLKEKQLKCMIIMEIIVQEHKLHVFQNLVYSFSATQFLFCVLTEKLIKYILHFDTADFVIEHIFA
jgi:hypothetical protein